MKYFVQKHYFELEDIMSDVYQQKKEESDNSEFF